MGTVKDETRYDRDQGRERWIHETDLINHRLNWLGISQGLLFTAYGLVATNTNPNVQDRADQLLEYIARAGLTLAAVILLGVFAAHVAMALIFYDSREKPNWNMFGVRWYTTAIGALTALSIPLVFAALWWALLP